ncbi:hypothetical protein L1887_21165 [Cichorium endivia]|nr:hypothetical protein L1887_21165 [Cichorium endivia]
MRLTIPRRETMRMVFICFSLCSFIPLVIGEGLPSAYDVIKRYNLPIGLLPEGVTGYNLDPNSGEFSIDLSSSCGVHAGKYKIKYSPTVTGTISENRIEGLGGVKVKIALFWIGIENVNRNGDQLEFQIGSFATKDFPVEEFDKSPECS